MEMKILNLSDYLSSKLEKLINQELEERVTLERQRQKSRLISFLPSSVFDFLVTLWMVYLVIFEKITLGSFQMFSRALSNVSQKFHKPYFFFS